MFELEYWQSLLILATGSGTQGINKVGCWDIKGMLPNN